MATGDKNETKCKTTDKVGMGKRGSEESDEDYMVGEDEELEESEDEYCSSLAEEESDESLGEFEEEEEENDEEEFVKKERKKAGKQRSGGGWSLQGTKKKGAMQQRKKNETYSDEYKEEDFAEAKEKKKRISSRKEKEDDDIWVYAAEDHDFGNGKPRRKAQVLSTDRYVDTCSEEPRKKAKVSYQEEEQDSDYDDSGDDDDVEFTPDEVDGVGDDEEVPVTKKNKMERLRMQQTRISNGRKRKRNVKALKKTKKMKATKQKVLRRKGRHQKKDFTDDNPTARKKRKNTDENWGRRQSSFNSDSDCGSLGPPDFEYTMSEEEREQIREASEFCRDLATSLMSSNLVKSIEEEETGPSQRKCQGKKGKGKDKVVDLKIEVGKQVCGICLSEEGKRTVRGILNCCCHYFCFPCIMEWSKVESRCPLCKQRFLTINRTTRADGGHGLRDAVIQVPERDQVYQPTEEELRAYLDPYENVLCTECHQGGDDALMLLCDICDSPAHTYCVGLGHEVPEGNWYCDGCKPTAFASNAQAPNLTLNCGANNNLGVGSSPVGTVRETFDLNELYIPETPSTQATTGHSLSIRNPTGYFQDVPSPSGSGVFTLFERRRIQRQIHQLLNDRARQLGRSENVAPHLGVSLFGSQICRDGAVLPQHTAPVPVPPQNIYNPGRLLSYTTPSWYPREIPSPPVFDSLRGQVLPHQASTSAGHSFSGLSHTETSGANPTNPNTAQGLGHQPLRPCNGRSNSGSEAGIFQYQFREVSHSSLEKAQVQSMVRSHLKSLSRNSDLGYITFKHIARTSTHTILAACGLQHRSNEILPVRTRPLMCDHFTRSTNTKTSPIAGQCPSCFDWFVRNVVREINQIMSTQV